MVRSSDRLRSIYRQGVLVRGRTDFLLLWLIAMRTLALQVKTGTAAALLTSAANGGAGHIGRIKEQGSHWGYPFEVLNGRLEGAQSPLLQGAMAHLVLWKRELTTTEIASHFGSHAYVLCSHRCANLTAFRRSVSSSSLVMWLRFGELSGSTAADSSGLGNAATLSGGAVFTPIADPLCFGATFASTSPFPCSPGIDCGQTRTSA